MITTYILLAFVGVWNFVFHYLVDIPVSLLFGIDIHVLPFGADDLLSQGMGHFFYVASFIPPLMIMYNAFLFYFSFKIVMLVLRLVRIMPHYRSGGY